MSRTHQSSRRRPCGGAIPSILAACCVVCSTADVSAATWTGAGQAVASQIRNWPVPANWSPPPPHPANDIHTFDFLGDGRIDLDAPQQAGGLGFLDFAYEQLAAGKPGAKLQLVGGGANPPAVIWAGEGVRDTYGTNYFTAGPAITADVDLPQQLSIALGTTAMPGVGGDRSALLLAGRLNHPNTAAPAIIDYTGDGPGTSLWITSTNDYRPTSGMTVRVQDGPGGPGWDGHTLHLADAGRLDGAVIVLGSITCQLGLQDNARGPLPNWYLNDVILLNGGNVFTDRSYQLNPFDATVNAVQWLQSVQVLGPMPIAHFGAPIGSPLTQGHTNNGFSLLAWSMTIADGEAASVMVFNGNLTEQRGGSRYVSGANRLQEAHNYVTVEQLNAPPRTPVGKGGEGVWWVQYVNGAGLWPLAPMVSAGVLRLGDPGGLTWPPNPHAMPPGQSLSLAVDAGVGIAWETQVNLPAAAPFPIAPAAPLNVGQTGAVDIDLWNFGANVFAPPTIDTNLTSPAGQQTYLRVGSSMGGDASFDVQPLPTKHASVAFQNLQGMPTRIVPYMSPNPVQPNTYYFGGGGGTLRIDSQLQNYPNQEQMGAALEMGTTGKLLPGRVALNPGGDVNPEEPNLYTGPTRVLAGTLQLMKQHAVFASAAVSVGTYDRALLQALYKTPSYPGAAWEGPGQLLLDPGRNPQGTGPTDWDLTWYTAGGAGGIPQPLLNLLRLDGGAIGWTANVTLPAVPGTYGATLQSDLTGAAKTVHLLGLGGEYSAGTMSVRFPIADVTGGPALIPVLLYKAGKNSVLDLRQMPLAPPPNGQFYTGGTIIAGGEILIDNAAQLNAEVDGAGGPVAILNGGRLRVAQSPLGLPSVDLRVPVKINTAGTPDVVKDCGSVIEVDANVRLRLMQPLDFAWNPTAYLEKEGDGFLHYEPTLPPNAGPANAWGLKLTRGQTTVNQLPVNQLPTGGSGDTGPVIFNDGHLTVNRVPAGVPIADTDPGYGFRALVSMQGTSSNVWIADDAMFRTHGWAPNEILGSVHFQAAPGSDATAANNVVHLSRNMAPQPFTLPADYSRGNGTLVFEGVTVCMSGGGNAGGGGPLNVLPQETGFVLTLGDGVAFHGSHQNVLHGEVNFRNTHPTRPVQINGAQAVPPTPVPPTPPYQFALRDDVWSIVGTGYTTWSGRTEKIGTGTVEFVRAQGAPVALGSGATLAVLDGKLVARGATDPFTDTNSGKSLTITCDATNSVLGYGLRIEEGSKSVASINGVGDTYVMNAGTVLTTSSIVQNTLTIGAGSAVVISPVPAAAASAVPEPGTWTLLAAAAACLWPLLRRKPRRPALPPT